MKQILLDTNIILDVFLDRTPWAREAKSLWQAIANFVNNGDV